jgi:hypothetical protein
MNSINTANHLKINDKFWILDNSIYDRFIVKDNYVRVNTKKKDLEKFLSKPMYLTILGLTESQAQYILDNLFNGSGS